MSKTNRKFTTRGLTHSAAHHLMATKELIEKRGYARVSDIARELDITRGSVSVTMQSLKAEGYVEQDDNSFFAFTDKGKTAIASIEVRHKVVELFLTDILGLSSEQSHRESCRLENLIEAKTTRRLSALIEYWRDNNLQGVLEKCANEDCPECTSSKDQSCPCCGLQCIDDSCPRQTAVGQSHASL